MNLNVEIVSCLQDNYSYIIRERSENLVGVVDPSEFKKIDNLISKKYKKLDYILNTHHHFDHIGGNTELKEKYNCKIIGSKIDKKRIPGADLLYDDCDEFKFGGINFKIILIPGHTMGHIAFYSKEEKIIFTGDTLFSLGCGRIFEGTFKQMFDSLNKIKKLPKDTKIYCGHEYTKKNLEFCLKMDPKNKALKEKLIWINDRILKKLPTVPVSIESELNENVFLRCNNIEIKNNLAMKDSSEELVFQKLRTLKDEF